VVYEIDGINVNVTITPNAPENKAVNSVVSFVLKVMEPFSARGTVVNPSDYYVSRQTLDFYLVSGVILDYDRSRVIDTLWINWADTLNKTYVEEERSLFLNNRDAVFSKSGGSYFGNAVLPELSQGGHNITIWIRAQQDQVTTYIPFWSAFSETIAFIVDTVAPKILILSQQNSTYGLPEVPLNFTVSERFSRIEYCLDGKSNLTVSGNTTLTGLSNGYHEVTVYATDEAGNTGSSETLVFNVNAPEAFPPSPVVASVVAVIAIGVGLLVYFKKRHRELGQA
jgi:hypothetical protein